MGERQTPSQSMPTHEVILGRSLDRRRLLAGSAASFAAALAAGRVPSIAHAQDVTPTAGGRAVVGLIQEPGQLSEFFNGQSGSFVSIMAVEPLFIADAAGEYQPVLAAEVPTLDNGGISADFLTITYKLKDGLTWSDGEPFTAEDIKFSFDVYKDPGTTSSLAATYELIESVTVVDPLTAQVKMTAVNPAYLDLWTAVLPKHKFDSTAITTEHELARIPLGTGPFVITEWKTGDSITYERNPNYRESGKPYLDGITIKITPEKEAAIASFINGDLDYLYFIVTGDLPALTQAQEEGKGVNVLVSEGGTSIEWLWLNLGTNGDPATPHSVLGDPAIREAIDYAIDRQAIIDEILGGFGVLEGSAVFAGWAGVHADPAPVDPEHAKSVLDAAGWVPGDGGIREKNGVKASLRYQCIAGDLTRELYQQLIQQNLKDVGIETTIENVPSNTIFGSYQEGGLFARGNYDLIMSRAGYEFDPVDWVALFTTDQIPTEENPNVFTYSFYSNPEFDQLAADAAASLDPAVRQPLYDQLREIFARDRPAIPLYQSAKADAWSMRIQGVRSDFFNSLGALYTTADWHVTE